MSPAAFPMWRWTGAGLSSPKAAPAIPICWSRWRRSIAQPYGGNPAGLPIEDASDFEFDDNNIFSFNQLPGYDLVESGPRANVGFIADALFPGGEVAGPAGPDLPPQARSAASPFSGRKRHRVRHHRAASRSSSRTWTSPTDSISTAATARSGGMKSMSPAPMAAPRCRSAICSCRRTRFDAWACPAASKSTPRRDINFYAELAGFCRHRARSRWPARCSIPNMAWAMRMNAWRFRWPTGANISSTLVQGVPPSTSMVLRFNLKTGDQPVQPFSLFPKNVFTTYPSISRRNLIGREIAYSAPRVRGNWIVAGACP